MKWISCIRERRWTDEEREKGIWVWEGFVSVWSHELGEEPRKLPRLSECHPGMMAKTQTGAYASHWMVAEGDIPPDPPAPTPVRSRARSLCPHP